MNLAVIKAQVDADLPGRLQIVLSAPTHLEITAPKVSKGTGGLRLMARLGLRPQECVAVGDGDNDISLFDAVGPAVTMANGSERARLAADRVIEANDAGGLERFLDLTTRSARKRTGKRAVQNLESHFMRG